MSRVALSCALAAALTVAAPGVGSTFAASSSSGSSTDATLLSAQLPKGKSLRTASCADTYDALKKASAQRPDLVIGLLRTAVKARMLKNGKFVCDCGLMVKLVDASATAAPDRTRDLAEDALSYDPDCAEALDAYLGGANLPGLGDTSVVGEVGEGGFGAGYGPGYPGSPGFVGSAPGGTIALPPVGVAVTSIVND